MDIFVRASSDDSICDFRRVEFLLTALVYKQWVVTKAGILLVFQFSTTITAAIVAKWGTIPTDIWGSYAVLWATAWPVFFLGIWLQFAWRFRRSKWTCANDPRIEPPHDHLSPADYDDQNDEPDGIIVNFPTTKFSNN